MGWPQGEVPLQYKVRCSVDFYILNEHVCNGLSYSPVWCLVSKTEKITNFAKARIPFSSMFPSSQNACRQHNKTTQTIFSNLLNGKVLKPGIGHGWSLVGWGISTPHGRTWECERHEEEVVNLNVLPKCHTMCQLAYSYPQAKSKVHLDK